MAKKQLYGLDEDQVRRVRNVLQRVEGSPHAVDPQHRQKYPVGGGGLRVKEGVLATGGFGQSTGGGTAEATGTLNVYKGSGNDWADSGDTVTVTNRDDTLNGPEGAYCIAARINGEWRPIWVGCAPANEVQRIAISGSPTGGHIRVGYDGLTSGDIAYNLTAAQVEAVLEALANIGSGNVSCTGGPLPGTPVDVEFVGDLAERNVTGMTIANNNLTGGTSPAAAVLTLSEGCCD